MKLLTPQAIKDVKSQELSRELLRSKETEEAIKKINQRRIEAETDFNTTLARNRNKWAQEEEEHANRVKEMDAEIRILEERKKQAMIPIQMYKDQADVLLAEAKEALDRAINREQIAEETQDLLENKLDDLGDRELAIDKAERAIKAKQAGILAQQEQVRAGSEKLTERMAEFAAKMAKDEAEIYEKKKDLVLIERSLVAKDEKIKRTIKSIEEEKIRLEDQRRTLERAFKRISP